MLSVMRSLMFLVILATPWPVLSTSERCCSGSVRQEIRSAASAWASDSRDTVSDAPAPGPSPARLTTG